MRPNTKISVVARRLAVCAGCSSDTARQSPWRAGGGAEAGSVGDTETDDVSVGADTADRSVDTGGDGGGVESRFAVAIPAGGRTSCVLLEDGDIRRWGRDYLLGREPESPDSRSVTATPVEGDFE